MADLVCPKLVTEYHPSTKIILSSIVHKRYGKIEHFFKYKIPSIFLDLDELEIIKSILYHKMVPITKDIRNVIIFKMPIGLE